MVVKKINDKGKRDQEKPVFLYYLYFMGNIILITGIMACFPVLYPDSCSGRSSRYGAFLGNGPPDYLKCCGMPLHYLSLYPGIIPESPARAPVSGT
jgi:hypothetical protein